MKLKIIALVICLGPLLAAAENPRSLPVPSSLFARARAIVSREAIGQAQQNPITPPEILTFAPGSTWSFSGLITPKGKTALDISTAFAKVALGKSTQWSLESDMLAGISIGGNANAGFGACIRYDSLVPLLGWSFFMALGAGEIFPLGAGNGPQAALIGSIGITIAK